MPSLPQAAELGEENPDGGWRDACYCVRDEEAGGFVPGETRGLKAALVWDKKNPFNQWFLSLLLWKSLTAFCSDCPPQSVEHLSWLGLFKDLSEGTHKPSPFYHKRALYKTREECEHVREKFLQMRRVSSSPSFEMVLELLTDVWCLLQLPAGVRGGEAVPEDSHLWQLVSL